MNRQSLLFVLLVAGSSIPAIGADGATALSRYEADKKLCAEESTSGVRMQCLRDAKAEHTKALAAAKQKMLADKKARASAGNCTDCGKVVAVAAAKREGKGGALGTIGGGVAGALLGRQVGGGKGKDLATVAGAVGGAYAGYKTEEKLRSTTVWSVTVRMDSGAQRVIEFDHDPGLANGDLVKVSGNTITRR